MTADPEGDLINRVAKMDDFFRSVLSDNLDDWTLAKDFGEFLVRLDPADALGHALLSRAFRHLGDRIRALEELDSCRARIAQPSEREALEPLLAEEEKHLRRT